LCITNAGVINYTAFRLQSLSYGFVWLSEQTLNVLHVILALCTSYLMQKVKHKGKGIAAQALKFPDG
jgi:hypothetical protein